MRDPSEIIPYKKFSDGDLSLHVFNPDGHVSGKATPAIVFFFGGGWTGGTPKQFYPQCEYLASRGMVAISAEYRTESSHSTTPFECVKDGKSAMRWLRSHAESLGIDSDRIIAGGGSAGGHVAATTATIEGFNEENEDLSINCCPSALALFNPVIDNSPGGYGHERIGDAWREFSPLHNLDSKCVPTVIFLGTRDDLVPVSTIEEYKARMSTLGTRCEVHLYEGQAHGFFNKNRFNETLEALDLFLISLGYLDGQPVL